MGVLDKARELAVVGQYGRALEMLGSGTCSREERRAHDLLRMILLERVGRHGQSRALSTILQKSRDLAPAERSLCELTLGKLAWEDGMTDVALVHFQRSAGLARQSKDLDLMFQAVLRTWIAVTSLTGPGTGLSLLSELRTISTRLGNPVTTAALHVYVGETEAKRGLLRSAERHLRIADSLLLKASNSWLEAAAANVSIGIAVIRSDPTMLAGRGQRALALAEESGVASTRRAVLGNIGNLLYLVGEFDQAVGYLEQALAALPTVGENSNANLDSLAKIRLAQGRCDECAGLLDQIDESVRSPGDRVLYSYRHSLLTRSALLTRQDRLDEALATADSVLALATEAGDHLLCDMALLARADLLRQTGRTGEALELLGEVAARLVERPLDLHAHYECVLACTLAADGDADAARLHYDRARRLYDSLHNAPGLLELDRAWDAARARAGRGTSTRAGDPTRDRPRAMLQSAAGLVLHANRPELVACELVQLLADAGAVHSVEARARDADGRTEILAAFTASDAGAPGPGPARLLAVGASRDRTIDVVMRARPDAEAAACVNAAAILLSAVKELERGRAEREERLTLWPIDDATPEPGDAVVTGHLRDLMTVARRIARTSVSVLITGESGTGKEILARAIHAHSDRADRPFIPFNCAAVPREMLESQLFGYRRGAFTGADRDHAGIIRAAREGTLFLDEIGELGLDLQPKLLRFLESGEILPLGEPAPTTVPVRVIAATNSELEQAVGDGRFREDLFYRLNVIRLRVSPLRERRDEIPLLVTHFVAAAAAEFRKGTVRMSEEAMEQMLLFPWPGNVRQLHNEVRRMVALADADSVLTTADLSDEIAGARPERLTDGPPAPLAVPLTEKLQPTLSRIEREMIRLALRQHHGRVDAAARALGISRKGLYLKRQRLGL